VAVERRTFELESGSGRYALLVAGLAIVAVAGYAGYVVYPRFELPPVEGAAVFGLAAAAGVASFFSPCSFPLLLAILGRHASARARGGAGSPALFGGALAVGAAGFLLLAGLLIAAGAGVFFQQVTFDSAAGIAIRAIVGVLLVGFGLVQVGLIRTPVFHAVERTAQPLMRRQARLRRQHPVAGYALFGFGYVLAGFG
jgi:cytochrome c-type biogenesis protein